MRKLTIVAALLCAVLPAQAGDYRHDIEARAYGAVCAKLPNFEEYATDIPQKVWRKWAAERDPERELEAIIARQHRKFVQGMKLLSETDSDVVTEYCNRMVQQYRESLDEQKKAKP